MTLQFGKPPFAPKATDFLFAYYADRSLLPVCPVKFGHYGLIGASAWGMLGNDIHGDCVFAGADHETMLWTVEGGSPAAFTPANAEADYTAVTGFNPAIPSSDVGADPRTVLGYRQKTGMIDCASKRHKIGAYLLLNQGDINEAHLASYLFSAVGIGLKVPTTMLPQFNAGEPWDVVPGAKLTGEGHYVPYLGSDGVYMYVVSWGRIQAMTPAFYLAYCDEAWAILSPEMLKGGLSLDGFNLTQLQADLAALNTTPIPAPVPTPTPTPTPVPTPPTPPAVATVIGQIGNATLETPAGPIKMAVVPTIVDAGGGGFTVIELDAIVSALDAKVTGWDAATKKFTITKDTSALDAVEAELAALKEKMAGMVAKMKDDIASF